ncbi:MAG: hypothetical protein Q6364_06285, partial [Candidatus Hermodarchaeota archaeon]|nr:hypothetical protein [Candidatus Hermodarchaeota archaeon]
MKYTKICVLLFSGILLVNFGGMVVFSSDSYYSGPPTTVLVFGDDQDIQYAREQIMGEFIQFIKDDPFIRQRLILICNPSLDIISSLGGIVVYVSHGSPDGLVTQTNIIPWAQVAARINQSPAKVHMFTACYSSQASRMTSSQEVLGFAGPVDVDVAMALIVSQELSILQGPEEGMRYFWSKLIEGGLIWKYLFPQRTLDPADEMIQGTGESSNLAGEMQGQSANPLGITVSGAVGAQSYLDINVHNLGQTATLRVGCEFMSVAPFFRLFLNVFSQALGAEISVFPVALTGIITITESLENLILDMLIGGIVSLAIMLAGVKLATYVAMATMSLPYGVIPLAVALGIEIVEWAWWTFIMPSIGHLVAIAFVQLLALILGVGSILHIGGLAPGVATAALETAA